MEYKTYDSAEKFLQSTLKSLQEDEAKNNLILGICNKIRDNEGIYKEKPFFAALEDGEKILLAAVMTPPRQLLLYGENYTSENMELFCHNLIKGGIPVPGVNGESKLVKEFADMWAEKKGCQYRPGMNMRVYRLNKVKYRGNAEGSLRLADNQDKELVADWIQGFTEDADVGKSSHEDAMKTAEYELNKKLLYIWEDKDRVSMAASTRDTGNGSVLAFVYTPEKYRNKGYASSCVAALSQHILDSGKKFCALFTDLSNPTSNSIYMRIGYEPICDFDEYSFQYAEK